MRHVCSSSSIVTIESGLSCSSEPLPQKDTFHAVGQRRFGQATKILKRFQHAADHCRGIAALDKGDEAHARVGKHRCEAVEFMILALLLEMKFAPIVLHLFSWFG